MCKKTSAFIAIVILVFALTCGAFGCQNNKMIEEMVKLVGDNNYCYTFNDGFVKDGKRINYEDYFEKRGAGCLGPSSRIFGSIVLGNKIFATCSYRKDFETYEKVLGYFDLAKSQMELEILHSFKSEEEPYNIVNIGDYLACWNIETNEFKFYDEQLNVKDLKAKGESVHTSSCGIYGRSGSAEGNVYYIYDKNLKEYTFEVERYVSIFSFTENYIMFEELYKKDEHFTDNYRSYIAYSLPSGEMMPVAEVEKAYNELNSANPKYVVEQGKEFKEFKDGEYVKIIDFETLKAKYGEIDKLYEINPEACVYLTGVLQANGETYITVGGATLSWAANASCTLVYRYDGENNFTFLGCTPVFDASKTRFDVIKLVR